MFDFPTSVPFNIIDSKRNNLFAKRNWLRPISIDSILLIVLMSSTNHPQTILSMRYNTDLFIFINFTTFLYSLVMVDSHCEKALVIGIMTIIHVHDASETPSQHSNRLLKSIQLFNYIYC